MTADNKGPKTWALGALAAAAIPLSAGVLPAEAVPFQHADGVSISRLSPTDERPASDSFVSPQKTQEDLRLEKEKAYEREKFNETVSGVAEAAGNIALFGAGLGLFVGTGAVTSWAIVSGANKLYKAGVDTNNSVSEWLKNKRSENNRDNKNTYRM